VRRWLRAAAAAPLALIAVATLAACESTIAPEATSPPPGASSAETAFVAEGTTAELLALLLDDSRRLSETIVDGDGDAELLARIDATWEAAAPGVEEVAPSLVDDFERAIELMHSGVTRRRPADADKASRNLEVLIAEVDR
jgi:hypothetical protein